MKYSSNSVWDSSDPSKTLSSEIKGNRKLSETDVDSDAASRNEAEDTLEKRERPSNKTHSLNNIPTIYVRLRVVKWMIQDRWENGKSGLMIRTIEHFPEFFTSTRHANIKKCQHWWDTRIEFCRLL